jgi:RNA polymerase sigma-70 factor, ECF subfamily
MTATQSMTKDHQQSARWEAMAASITLEAAYALGRSTWAEVALSYESFCAHVARLGYTCRVGAAHAADLYLCAACEDGQTAAYHALEASYFPRLEKVIGKFLGEQAATEEVLQEIRTRLFVGNAPKIASYRGSGPLAGWLRSLAVHAAQDRLRSNSLQRGRLRKLASAQQDTPSTTALDESGEAAFRRDHTRLCGQAWSAAITSLGSEERQLLHHYFVSGLSIDTLAPLYRVHRATIHRRICRATERVRQRVREALTSHYWELTHRDLDALAFSACLDLGAALVHDTADPSHAA